MYLELPVVIFLISFNVTLWSYWQRLVIHVRYEGLSTVVIYTVHCTSIHRQCMRVTWVFCAVKQTIAGNWT